MLKIFLANLLDWRNYHRMCVFFMSTWKFQHIVWYSKTCITHKRNLRIDCRFGNNLTPSISTVCHKKQCVWITKWTFKWPQLALYFKVLLPDFVWRVRHVVELWDRCIYSAKFANPDHWHAIKHTTSIIFLE